MAEPDMVVTVTANQYPETAVSGFFLIDMRVYFEQLRVCLECLNHFGNIGLTGGDIKVLVKRFKETEIGRGVNRHTRTFEMMFR